MIFWKSIIAIKPPLVQEYVYFLFRVLIVCGISLSYPQTFFFYSVPTPFKLYWDKTCLYFFVKINNTHVYSGFFLFLVRGGGSLFVVWAFFSGLIVLYKWKTFSCFDNIQEKSKIILRFFFPLDLVGPPQKIFHTLGLSGQLGVGVNTTIQKYFFLVYQSKHVLSMSLFTLRMHKSPIIIVHLPLPHFNNG